jgi:hypothetical protein
MYNGEVKKAMQSRILPLRMSTDEKLGGSEESV